MSKTPAVKMINMRRPDLPNRFTFTFPRKQMAIRPRDGDKGPDYAEQQTYSPDLYIKDDFVIDETTPLYQMIQSGIIVVSPNESEIPGYKVYRFFRELEDSINYDENGDEIDEPIVPKKRKNQDKIDHVENDCLKFAEALGIAIYYGDMDYLITHLQTDSTDPALCLHSDPDVLFGEGIRKNRKLFETAGPLDNDAVPQPGQSYAIVRRNIKQKTTIVDGVKKTKTVADYHIAFVIYQLNGINITLEAEADNGRYYLPTFGFYDTNPRGYTFHRRWAGQLPDDDPDRTQALYSNGHTYVLNPSIKARIKARVISAVSSLSKKSKGGKKSNRTLRKKDRQKI